MGQPILEVEHLKKSYVNNVPILDDVSFSLQKGEVVVIVGPSGCGNYRHRYSSGFGTGRRIS